MLVFEGAASMEVACDMSVQVHESSRERQAGLAGKQEETCTLGKIAPGPAKYIRQAEGLLLTSEGSATVGVLVNLEGGM